MTQPSRRREGLLGALRTLTRVYAISGAAGIAMSLANIPLAWMIGPLIITAFFAATGIEKEPVPLATRPYAQCIIATYVGSQFSHEAFQALGHTAPILLAVGVATISISWLIARLQSHIFGTDPVTAYLSAVPTSPVEAALMAERHNLSPIPVIFSQTLRIATIVICVPPLVFMFGDAGNGVLPPQAAEHTGTVAEFALMIAGASFGAVIFRRLGLPNPYFLGPLLISAMLAAGGWQNFPIPNVILAMAQIVLGTWLGSCFRPQLLGSSRDLILSTMFSNGLLLIACCGGAALVAPIIGAETATLVLGAAPGGVTEMALTASVLGLDVAFVTAIQLARIFMVMSTLSWFTGTAPPQSQPEAPCSSGGSEDS